MSIKTFAAAALLAGSTSVSAMAPAAHAQNFGVYGACDSGQVELGGLAGDPGFGGVLGGGFKAAGRDCRDARNWQSQENDRDRTHATQTQLIGLGGNLLTGLIVNGQARQAQQPAPLSAVELELQHQQQEIELLKLKLQLAQQQAGQGAAGQVIVFPQGSPGYGLDAGLPVNNRF